MLTLLIVFLFSSSHVPESLGFFPDDGLSRALNATLTLDGERSISIGSNDAVSSKVGFPYSLEERSSGSPSIDSLGTDASPSLSVNYYLQPSLQDPPYG